MNRLHRMFILRAILLLVMALNVYSKLNKNIFLFYHLIILILILNEFFRYLLINKKRGTSYKYLQYYKSYVKLIIVN